MCMWKLLRKDQKNMFKIAAAQCHNYTVECKLCSSSYGIIIPCQPLHYFHLPTPAILCCLQYPPIQLTLPSLSKACFSAFCIIITFIEYLVHFFKSFQKLLYYQDNWAGFTTFTFLTTIKEPSPINSSRDLQVVIY